MRNWCTGVQKYLDSGLFLIKYNSVNAICCYCGGICNAIGCYETITFIFMCELFNYNIIIKLFFIKVKLNDIVTLN